MNINKCHICGGENIFNGNLKITLPFESYGYSICMTCLNEIKNHIDKEKNKECYVLGDDEE